MGGSGEATEGGTILREPECSIKDKCHNCAGEARWSDVKHHPVSVLDELHIWHVTVAKDEDRAIIRSPG